MIHNASGSRHSRCGAMCMYLIFTYVYHSSPNGNHAQAPRSSVYHLWIHFPLCVQLCPLIYPRGTGTPRKDLGACISGNRAPIADSMCVNVLRHADLQHRRIVQHLVYVPLLRRYTACVRRGSGLEERREIAHALVTPAYIEQQRRKVITQTRISKPGTTCTGLPVVAPPVKYRSLKSVIGSDRALGARATTWAPAVKQECRFGDAACVDPGYVVQWPYMQVRVHRSALKVLACVETRN